MGFNSGFKGLITYVQYGNCCTTCLALTKH